MGLHDGHRQRCKRRYLAAGAEGMDDHQLLELLLFFAIPRQDTNETAHRLVRQFGSMQGVLRASADELMTVDGVGENAAVLLRLAGDMALRARCSAMPQTVLNSTERTGVYFMELLAGDPAFSLSRKELEALMEPQRYIGRCPQQVRRFLDACVPLLHQAQTSDGDIRI